MSESIQIFDRAEIRKRREKIKSYNAHDFFLFEWAGKELLSRLGDINRIYPNTLQIGARTSESFTKHLKEKGQIERLVTADLCSTLLKNRQNLTVQMDEEFLPFASQTFNLVLSPLSLHCVNDLPGALIQIRRALKPDGLFMGVLFGGETLYELRQCLGMAEQELNNGISPRVFPFADKPQMGDLLMRGGFNLPVVDSEILRVEYDSIFSLLYDLRQMAETNTILNRNKIFPGKKLFLRAGEIYHDTFSNRAGKITASFEMIFMIGWAPHEAQQKPLRPGSAEKSMAEALGTIEQGAGEKPVL